MSANETARIEALGSPASPKTPEAPGPWSHPYNRLEPEDSIAQRVRLERPNLTNKPGGEAGTEASARNEAYFGHLAAGETYVRIRYDEDRNTYFIQVFDAASDEIIREIPPDGWAKASGNLPAPKGLFVEETQ